MFGLSIDRPTTPAA